MRKYSIKARMLSCHTKINTVKATSIEEAIKVFKVIEDIKEDIEIAYIEVLDITNLL